MRNKLEEKRTKFINEQKLKGHELILMKLQNNNWSIKLQKIRGTISVEFAFGFSFLSCTRAIILPQMKLHSTSWLQPFKFLLLQEAHI